MEFLFEEHCIECIYEKDGTVTSIKTFNCKKENYINNTAYVYYNRNRNFKLSIKPFTRLYIKKLILTFQTNCANVSCFVNGYQSWTYTGVFDAVAKKRKPWLKFVIANQENAANPPKGKRGLVQSDMFFLCGDSNSQSSVLFGQLPVKKQFQQFISFEFDYRTQLLSIIWDIDRYCDAHEEYILDPVCMLQGDAWRILQTYAESISQELSPTFNRNIRKGWCSWYYYYNSITKDEIIANAKYAKEQAIPFDFIQIDDGYQTTIGEWTTVKGSFTAAMRYIADTIKDYGFTPGIWYSPFIVSKDSRIFKENKSWILKDSEGKPVIAGYNPVWGGYYYTVDVTLPAVLSWIEDTINTLLYEWGYEYLKLDFMYAAALPGKRHNTSVSRYQALNNAVARIRKASGSSFLLGCGMPLQCGIGHVDAMRIGPDVAPQWGRTFFDKLFNSDSGISTRSAIRSSIYRSFMHNKFWINDPDCLMLRHHKTKLTKNEQTTLFNVITALGGMLVVSDKLNEYTQSELNLLMKACELFDAARDGEIYVYDLLEKEPRLFYNSNGFALILNLDDKLKTVSLPMEIAENSSTIFQFDDQRYTQANEYSFQLLPHSSKLFIIKR